jgi:predicted dehydrogenase
MPRLTRRQFLATTAAAAGTIALPRRNALGNVLGANEKLRIACIGLHGQGGAHVGSYAEMNDVEIAYLVDVDTRQFGPQLEVVVDKQKRRRPQTLQDARKALDDRDLHAVSIATPNHWHALLTIWACQAGKDVYVEKPMCHNAREGVAMMEAARRYKRLVQHGTQRRSEKEWAHAIAAIRSGELGKLIAVRGLCYKDGGTGGSTRGNIGFKPVKPPPSELDFNLWLGPAPKQPYHENLVHYRWHWFWDFGNGDLGNQGVHQMDVGHWGLPEGSRFPSKAYCLGGRYTGEPDQGQCANEQVAVFQYGDIPFIFEVRGLKSPKYQDVSVGNIFELEAGQIREADYYPKGSNDKAPLPKVDFHVEPGGPFRNFVDAVKVRDPGKLNAPLERGFYPSVLCHLANASHRTGEKVTLNRKSTIVENNKAASEAFDRMREHLGEHGIDLATGEYTQGRILTLADPASWKTDDEQANAILAGSRHYRPPFELPADLVARS